MEKGKVSVDVEKRIVVMGHETKTMDGSIELTTTFDFSKVNMATLLKDAAASRLIKWRASSGIKKLSTKEASEKLVGQVVDCSKIAERVKHVETPEEKELRETIKAIMAGQSGTKMSLGEIAKRLKEITSTQSEGDASESMEEGETTE